MGFEFWIMIRIKQDTWWDRFSWAPCFTFHGLKIPCIKRFENRNERRMFGWRNITHLLKALLSDHGLLYLYHQTFRNPKAKRPRRSGHQESKQNSKYYFVSSLVTWYILSIQTISSSATTKLRMSFTLSLSSWNLPPT